MCAPVARAVAGLDPRQARLAGDDTLLVSLRDLYDAVTGGLYGGRTDPVTGLPYRLQDTMPEAVLTQCRHWVNYPQARKRFALC